MTDDDRAGWTDLLTVAARLVGGDLEPVDLLRQGTVRCRQGDRTVIVKRPRLPPGEVWDRHAPFAGPFLTNVAGLAFLGPLGPGLIGADPDAGVLVMADLGAAPGLDPVLLTGSAEEATAAFGAWAEALGTLHAACAGRRAEYEAVRATYGPPLPSGVDALVAGIGEALAGLGVVSPADALRAALTPSDPALDTWLHRDPCPDNVLLLPTGARIIDYERGAFGPATLDGAFVRMAMPTCWCVGTVPASVLAGVEARWRAAAAVGIPALRDDARFSAAIADGCAHFLALGLGWHLGPALAEDRTWGQGTLRERILTRLGIFANVPGWPELHALADALAPVLRERWGPMGLRPFPAFRVQQP